MLEQSKCTCRPGRDWDGSEFGPCEHCESEADRGREHAAILRDAARWRISQVKYPRSMDDPFGYFSIEDDDAGVISVGIQPHPATKATSINACILGRASTEGVAIDRMFLALDGLVEGGAVLPAEIEGPRKLAALTSQKRGE
jgi:hypothetical protein